MSRPNETTEPEWRCAEAEHAALYVAGALDRAERDAFAAHAETCAACRAELDLHAATVAQLDLVQVQDDLAHGRGVEARGSLREALFASLGANAPRVASESTPSVAARGEAASTSAASLDRKWQHWSGTPGETIAPGLVNVPNSDAGWEAIGIAGISVKRLSVDAAARKATMLIRMAPGTSYPRHRHASREECFVLEGSLQVGESTLRAGDFQVAEENSIHAVQSTETGCLLLIVSSQDDELV
ncbi:MAG: cupin domain-containing protein [Planctomycetes bacterium]|nr:cupin domain-containing protein [Planctomycetota bacterium]